MKRNKMVEGMLIGAAVGAAISLFDKETRENTIESSKKVGSKAKTIIKQPEIITNAVQHNLKNVIKLVEDVSSDVRYIAGKVNELSETTPEMLNMIKDTGQTIKKELDDNGEEN